MNMIEKRKQMRGQGGFTLIELLVVIAILGILAGVVVFAVANLTGEANTSACEIEERSLLTAVQAAEASADPDDDYTDFLQEGDTPTYWEVTGTPPAVTPLAGAPATC